MRVVSNGAIEQASTDSEGMRFSASLRLLASAEVGRRHANACHCSAHCEEPKIAVHVLAGLLPTLTGIDLLSAADPPTAGLCELLGLCRPPTGAMSGHF
jgi:hypothetical protein